MYILYITTLIVGLILAAVARFEHKNAERMQPLPTEVALANLQFDGAPDGNAHVRITQFNFAKCAPVWEKRSRGYDPWVWLPLTLPGQPKPVAMFRSDKFVRDSELAAFCGKSITLTGVVMNDEAKMDQSDALAPLRLSYPEVDFSRLPLLIDRQPPSTHDFADRMQTVGVWMVVLSLAGIVWRWFRNRGGRTTRRLPGVVSKPQSP